MDLKTELLLTQSKRQVDKLIDYIRGDFTKFQSLMTLFFSNEYRVVQKASWVVTRCIEDHPDWIDPYLDRIVEMLEITKDSSIRRNIIRLLQFVDIPEMYQGRIYDTCLRFLMSSRQPVAVRVFSMSVLSKITKNFPELKEELAEIIKDGMVNGTPGYKARARKVLAEIKN
jgi:hypothetical protein